jgi:hypothetical protein
MSEIKAPIAPEQMAVLRNHRFPHLPVTGLGPTPAQLVETIDALSAALAAKEAENERMQRMIKNLQPVAAKYRRDVEATSYPWWAVVEPVGRGRYGVLAGPFLDRPSAESELKARRYNYAKKATVFCFSGCNSPEWQAFADAMRVAALATPAAVSEANKEKGSDHDA